MVHQPVDQTVHYQSRKMLQTQSSQKQGYHKRVFSAGDKIENRSVSSRAKEESKSREKEKERVKTPSLAPVSYSSHRKSKVIKGPNNSTLTVFSPVTSSKSKSTRHKTSQKSTNKSSVQEPKVRNFLLLDIL